MTPSRWYSEHDCPLSPCTRRTWREWLQKHGVRAYRAGPRLLAERDQVDAAIVGAAPQFGAGAGTEPAPLADDAQAALARAGLRLVGGAR